MVPQPRVLLRHLAFRRRYRQEEQGGLLLLPRQSGDPANWNHSYTQYITRAGWDSYKVHGGPSTVAEKLADQGAEDVQGLLASKSEPDNNDNQNNNDNSLIDWSGGR